MTGEPDDRNKEKYAAARRIVRRLQEAGHEAYFVGGAVRDFLRGVTPGDYDIATGALPDEVAALFDRTVNVGARFGVMMVVAGGFSFEVATFRSDDAYEDGRRPSRVHYASAREDALRRDFTINGLFQDPETGAMLDYVGGRADLARKIIRAIGDPAVRFREDYLRLLRAVRLAANLDFALDPETRRAVGAAAENIRRVSAERIAEELQKILVRGGARRGFELLSETGLLAFLLPEVEHMRGVAQPPRFHPEGDVWEHTMRMLEILSSETAPRTNPALAWAVLLHDVGKPVSKTEDDRGIHFYGHVQTGAAIAEDLMRRLRFPNAQRKTVVRLIREHMAFMNVTKMRPARLKRFLRMPDFDLHMQLHRLDCLACHGMLDYFDFCREQLQTLEREALHPPRLLTGDDLLAMGYAPGKQIGEILRALEDRQLEGGISNREDAAAFVQARWAR